MLLWLDFWSPLRSFNILFVSSILDSNPKALKTTLRFQDSIIPDPDTSKKSNAFFISYLCTWFNILLFSYNLLIFLFFIFENIIKFIMSYENPIPDIPTRAEELLMIEKYKKSFKE